MVSRLLGWLIRGLIRWVGAYTLLALTLLLIGLGSLVLTLGEILQGQGVDLLLPVTIGGLLLGWGLAAARPVPGWLAGLLISALGLELVLLRVGRLDSTVIRAGGSLARLVWQTRRWPLDGTPDPTPFLVALVELGRGLSILLSRLSVWLLGFIIGNPIFDLTAATLAWSLSVGAVAVWAAWGVRRLEKPLLAMVPAGGLLATILAYALRYEAGLLPLVGTTLMLMGLVRYRRRERRWKMKQVDFALNIRSDLGLAIVYTSLTLLVLAGTVPSFSVNQIVSWAQSFFQADSTIDSLGVRRPSARSDLHDKLAAPGLPRRHLLGSGPELSEQVALIIKTDDPEPAEEQPAPRYYWRSLTYDIYSGRGWLTSGTEARNFAAGEAAPAEPLPARRLVRQEVEAIGRGNDLLFAAGELLTADRDYAIFYRNPDDFFGATVGASRYQVDSLVPTAAESELRQAGADYPRWIRQRYLRLPRDLPRRVLSLARDLTATAPTPYDQAKAIETHLRAFPYSLDLPEPPDDRDMVDYFLFELQQGYCDYYATSMIVLARAVGLPARLAVGYLGNRYNPDSGRYIITEAEAHSWVEIYFPGYGWINFEPTGGRPALTRSGEPETPGPILTDLPAPVRKGARGRLPWWLGLMAGLTLAPLTALAWLAIDSWRLHAATPGMAVARLYQRLYRHGQRLDSSGQAGATPYEFAGTLEARVASLARGQRWAGLFSPAAREIRLLTELYVQTLYSPHPPDRPTQLQAVRTWQRLQRRLWFAWLHLRMIRSNISTPSRQRR